MEREETLFRAPVGINKAEWARGPPAALEQKKDYYCKAKQKGKKYVEG